jgi:hypothetical protein
VPKPLSIALVVLGFALVVWGGVGLASSLLGWDRSAPEVRSETVVTSAPSTPDGHDGEEHRLAHGKITMHKVLRDGGEVGCLFFVVVGAAIAFAAWPRRATPTPSA